MCGTCSKHSGLPLDSTAKPLMRVCQLSYPPQGIIMKKTEMAQFRVRVHQYGVPFLYMFTGNRWRCVRCL